MNRPILTLVSAFLAVFVLLPMLCLVAMGFTGAPMSLTDPFAHPFTLSYYVSFFEELRYRQGFLNAVGLGPVLAVLTWIAARLSRHKGFLKHLPSIMVLVMAGTCLFAALWPWIPGLSSLGHLLAPGKTVWWRLLRACGYCTTVTFLATCVGVAVAFCLTRTSMPGRGALRLLAVTPLALPTFLGALAFKNLLGSQGIVTRALGVGLPWPDQSPISAAIVQVFLFFPLVVLTTAAALDRIDPSLAEAASVQGSTRNFTFWTVSLPVIAPGIAAGSLLVFIRSFGDFAALSLLMPISYPMIVLEAYRDQSGTANFGGSAMLSTIMVVSILMILALQKYFVEGGTYQTVTGKTGGQGRLSAHPGVRYGALALVLAVFSVPAMFLAATVLSSLAKNWGSTPLPPAYTITRYTRALSELFEENSPLFNSFALVIPALLGTTALSFTIAYLISRGKSTAAQVLDFACMLPFVVPGVAFAVGLLGAFNRPIFGLDLNQTAPLIILAYVATRVPYGVRSTLASFQQIGTSMEESSKTMGGTPDLTLCKVTVPLVLPGVVAGAVMVFISCMDDVAITLMCAPPRWYPASIYVFHQIQNGNLFEASAYGVIVMTLVVVPYLLVQKLGGEGR